MDWEFFVTVARRLKELEAEKAQRYADKTGDSEAEYIPRMHTVFRHRLIMNSVYWHRGDEMVTADCFDLDPPHFPDAHVRLMRSLSSGFVQRTAARPYDGPITHPVLRMENTKTLIARIIALKLERLLQ